MATKPEERGGLRGRLDKLYKDHMEKAAALKIVIDALDADDLAMAREAAPQKFLQAIRTRDAANGDEAPVPKKKKQKHVPRQPAAVRLQQITDVLQRHPGATTGEIGDTINLHHNRVSVLVRRIAKGVERGGRMGWVLKGKASETKRSKAGRAPRKPIKERLADITAFLSRHPESTVNEVGNAINLRGNRLLVLMHKVAKQLPKDNRHEFSRWVLKKSAANGNGKTNGAMKQTRHHPAVISGKRLTLFLLEHLNGQESRTLNDIVTDLTQAGSPVRSAQALNGPVGAVLLRHGLARKLDEGGYQRTEKGAQYALTLRTTLEQKGQVAAGAYTA